MEISTDTGLRKRSVLFRKAVLKHSGTDGASANMIGFELCSWCPSISLLYVWQLSDRKDGKESSWPLLPYDCISLTVQLAWRLEGSEWKDIPGQTALFFPLFVHLQYKTVPWFICRDKIHTISIKWNNIFEFFQDIHSAANIIYKNLVLTSTCADSYSFAP